MPHAPSLRRWSTQRRFSISLLVALTTLAGCGRLPRVANTPRSIAAGSTATLLGPTACVPFQWVVIPKVSARALIRVPVQVAGQQRWYQFDTGAFKTRIYQDPEEIQKRGWPLERQEKEMFTRAPVSLGEVTIADARLLVHGRTRGALVRAARPLLRLPLNDGTLGLDVLIGRVAVIDYPAQRLCLLEADRVPAELERRTEWAPAEVRNGHFFIRTVVNGEPLGGVIFDTGASLFPLSIDHGTWKRLTGRSGEELENRRISVNSWGRQIPFVGAPALGALDVGSVRLERPLVYYSPTRPDYFAGWSYPVTGIMGNAPVWDRVVVLDARSERPRFGLLH